MANGKYWPCYKVLGSLFVCCAGVSGYGAPYIMSSTTLTDDLTSLTPPQTPAVSLPETPQPAAQVSPAPEPKKEVKKVDKPVEKQVIKKLEDTPKAPIATPDPTRPAPAPGWKNFGYSFFRSLTGTKSGYRVMG